MANETVKIPDLGGVDEVVVLEVLVKVGDSVTTDQPLMSLESEKASMDVPSDRDGKVTAILLQVGDKVREGDACISVEANSNAPKHVAPQETADAEAAAVAPQTTITPAPTATKTVAPTQQAVKVVRQRL